MRRLRAPSWLVLVVVAAPTLAGAATPVALEVELDPSIPEASALSEWIAHEGSSALTELEPSDERRGTVRVSVTGALYEYAVSIAAMRDDGSPPEVDAWACECTHDELLARIHTGVVAAAQALDPPTSTVAPSLPPPSPSPPGPFEDLRLRGRLGLGLMAGGTVTAVVGIALLGAGKKSWPAPDDVAQRDFKDYRIPGVPTLVAGVGVLAAGAALYVLDRRRARGPSGMARVRPLVLAGPQTLQLGLRVRL